MREGIVLEAATFPVFLGVADDVDDPSICRKPVKLAGNIK